MARFILWADWLLAKVRLNTHFSMLDGDEDE